MEIALIVIIAILVSGFGTIVGFGGGVFMVPILIIFFHVPIDIAIGSVILALFPGSLISTIFNYRLGNIDFRAGILLELPTMGGTVLGAYLTAVVPVQVIELIFAFFISALGIYMFRKANKETIRMSKDSLFYKLNRIGPGIVRRTNNGAYRMSFLLVIIFGLLAGMLAGFFGIGGGFLKTPIMVNVFGIPPVISSATALFMIVFTSLTGSVTHYFLGHLDFAYSLPIVGGFIAGAFIGNSLSLKISEKLLTKLIGVGLLLAGFSVFMYIFLIKT